MRRGVLHAITSLLDTQPHKQPEVCYSGDSHVSLSQNNSPKLFQTPAITSSTGFRNYSLASEARREGQSWDLSFSRSARNSCLLQSAVRFGVLGQPQVDGSSLQLPVWITRPCLASGCKYPPKLSWAIILQCAHTFAKIFILIYIYISCKA